MNTVLYDNVVVIVAVGVNTVWNFVPIDVFLALPGPPALAAVRSNIDDLEGGEKAILDALLEAVGIERLTEVVDVRDVLNSQFIADSPYGCNVLRFLRIILQLTSQAAD